MMMPCTVCGTINRIKPDAELIFCTACGSHIELGVHSYRTESEGPRVFCVNCSLGLDTTTPGLVFSCNECSENVCDMCSKLFEGKHYCPNCYSQLPGIEKTSKKTGKKSKAKKPRKKATAKKAGKTKAKGRGKSTSKKSGKSKQKTKSKPKGKAKSSTKRKSRGGKKK